MNAQITAKIIEHSISPTGKELISIEAVAPYFLDGEICKHRMLSANSSSNRAIPFNKMQSAEYFIPTDLRLNQPGMQGFEIVTEGNKPIVKRIITKMRDSILDYLTTLDEDFNVHKQHLNRYIAPWSMQKKILTGTREVWEGVMLLRDHPDADPAIQIWAKQIQDLLQSSAPNQLYIGDWHMPYITQEERAKWSTLFALKVSVARCARTSYRLHDGKETTEEADIKLFMQLNKPNTPHDRHLDH